MRSIIIGIAILLSVGLAAAAQDTAAEVPANGATINLKPTKSGYAADIFLPAGKYKTPTATSSDPAISTLLGTSVETRDEPSAKDASKTETFTRIVTVLLRSGAVPQGTYRFTLKLEGAEPVTRDLVLAVPASQVDTIDTLVVLSEWGKFYGDAISANQPQLWETSRKSWLTHITLEQKNQTDAGADPAGRIKVKPANLEDLSPGKNALIRLGQDYELDGSFPLGTAKGKLVLNADQLAGPVTFNFEVRSRIWVVFLFAPMVIGLILGYIARHRLVDYIALGLERRKSYELARLIGVALRDNADSIFQASAKTAQTHALEAANAGRADQVKSRTDAAQSEFQSAVTELKGRRDDLARKISELSAIAGANYDLPAAIKAALQDAQSNIGNAIAAAMQRNDVRSADEKFTSTNQELRTATLGAAEAWVAAVSRIERVTRLLGPAFGLDGTDLGVSLKAIADPVEAARAGLYRDTAGAITTLKTLLDALHGNIDVLRQFRNMLVGRIGDRLDDLTKLLVGVPLPNPQDWQDWLAASQGFVTSLRALTPEDPDTTAATKAGSDLATRLHSVVKQQTSDAALQGELETLLQQNHVAEAIAKLAEALHPKSTLSSTTATASISAASRGQSAITAIVGAAAPLVFAQQYPTAAGLDAASIAALQAGNEWQMETAGWLQTAIAGVVIMATGYFTFAGAWIGTPLDFAVVAFWAFGTDISLDAAATAAKNFHK